MPNGEDERRYFEVRKPRLMLCPMLPMTVVVGR
jgi:hypothetical protein